MAINAPRYQGQLTSQQPIRSNAPQMFQSLASRLTAFSEGEENQLDRVMQKKAKEKGLIDAQGKTAITLRDGNTVADEAWNAGATASHLAAVKIDIAENSARISQENEANPEGYAASIGGYSKGLLQGVPDGIKPLVENELAGVALKGGMKAQADLRTAQREDQATTLESGIEGTAKQAVQFAIDGDIEGMIENFDQSMAGIDALEAGDFITPAQAKKRRNDLNAEVDKAAVLGSFEKDRKEGNGDEFLQKFLANPPKDLDQDQVQKYAGIMDSAVARDIRVAKRMEADELSSVSAVRTKQASDLEVAVHKEEADETDVENAFQSNIITGTKRTSLLNKIFDQHKEALEKSDQMAKVAASMNGGVPLSSINKDDKAAVNAYTKNLIEMVDPLSDEGMNQITNLVSSTTIMPNPIQELVQSYAKAGDPQKAVQSAELLARIHENSPQALSAVSADVKAFSLLVSRQVAAGTDPEMAVELARNSVFETTPEQKQVYTDTFKSNTPAFRESNTDYLDGKLDDDFDPFMTIQPSVNAAMAAENNLLVDQYLAKTQDIDTARSLAYEDLKHVWGRSTVNGDPEMMKYPPELKYGEWDMRQQLMSDVKSFLPAVENEGDLEPDPKIIADPRTAREEVPTYLVMIKDELGMDRPLLDENGLPKRWIPDYPTSQEGKESQKELEALMAEAKEERAQRTESLPEKPMTMRSPTGEVREVESTM